MAAPTAFPTARNGSRPCGRSPAAEGRRRRSRAEQQRGAGLLPPPCFCYSSPVEPSSGRAEMAAESNLEILRKAYANWANSKGANVEEIIDMFDEDIEMHSALAPEVPAAIAGVHIRKSEARDYLAGLLNDWEMISYDVDRFIVDASGNEIVMVGRCAWRNKTNGNVVDSPKIDIHSFRDGKVVRFQESFDTLGFARALGHV